MSNAGVLRLLVVLLAVTTAGCAALTRDPPAPPPISRATVFDLEKIRFLPFEEIDSIRQSIDQSISEETP